ncbi:MAG: D-alanyl-D-alanine carboxypeptidase/D-alanyl-D-alanine endopeptidase [Steroidobacteraceae bacterium]|jgi:D-alanyl-D-alanine carboxypeptidase/D-alanyl-D-alanine-endopeptidase (penicillin-binding protein 4)
MRRALTTIVFAALALLLALPAYADWSALARLQLQGALVSASAVNLRTGRVLEQLDPSRRLTPASLTKLATAAAALQVWPPDQQFQTRLESTGAVRGDVLRGDLILAGAGDPSLTDRSLWVLANAVRAAGIRAVDGALRVDPLPFGSVACADQDRCAAQLRSDNAYNAPLSAIGVDYGTWCVQIMPTSPGNAARVGGCAVSRLPIAVTGTIRTVPQGWRQTFWVEQRTVNGTDTLAVGGEVPMGHGQRVYRAMSDPAYGTGLLLKEELREIGIRINGPVQVHFEPLPAGAQVLGHVGGLMVREQLWRMLQYSNNYIADVLTLDMGALAQPHETLASASRVLSNFVAQTERDDPPRVGPPPLYSGSGLTTANRLSANDLVDLLVYEYHDTRRFPAFYAGLAVPHDAPFAFLRQGDAAWLNRVALKTGTLNQPRSVCGIAGYLRKRDGGWIAFAAIVNGGPHWRHVPLYQAIGAERAGIEALARRY